MANIGNRKSAELIWNHVRSYNDGAPKGWREFHSGSIRRVFLNKAEGVVYKVDTEWYRSGSDGYSNYSELRNGRLFASRQKKGLIGNLVKIPKVSGFTFHDDSGPDVVIAMEYVTGIRRKASVEARKQLHALNFEDMHSFNFKVDTNGYVWPIDMASPRYPGASDGRVLH